MELLSQYFIFDLSLKRQIINNAKDNLTSKYPVATEGLTQFPPSFSPLDNPHIPRQYPPDEPLHGPFDNIIIKHIVTFSCLSFTSGVETATRL